MRKAVLFGLLIISLHAQSQTKFGVQAGAVASKLGAYKSIITYKGGAFAEIPINHKLFFSPELNLAPKGAKTYESLNYGHQSNWELSEIENKIFLHYVEASMIFSLKLHPQKNSFYFGAGPSVAMGISGSGTRNLEYSDYYGNIIERKTEKYKAMFDNKNNSPGELSHFRKFEFGVGLLTGYTLNSGMRFRLKFNAGFPEIAPNAIIWEERNNYLDFMIGYSF